MTDIKSTSGRYETDMTEGPVFKKLFLFSVPIFLTNLLQRLYNAADMIVVGNLSAEGDVGIAAIGSTTSLYHLMTNLFIGIGVGVCAVTARHIGAEEKEKVPRTVSASFIMAVFFGILVAVLGFIYAPDILTLMKTDKEVFDDACLYLRIVSVGSPMTLLYNFGTSVLRAIGDAKRPLRYLLICGALNVVLNVIFTGLFSMSAEGVALATVLSQTLSAFLVWRCLVTDNAYYRFDIRHITFDFSEARKVLFIGIPSGIQSCTYSFSNVILQSHINVLGKDVMAGASAAQDIEGVLDTIVLSVSAAVLSFTGQNYGAGNIKRVKKTLYCGLLISVSLCLIAACPIVTFDEFFISLYNKNEAVIKAGAMSIAALGYPYFLAGIMYCFASVLRGMGHSLTPTLISVTSIVGTRLLYIGYIYRNMEQNLFNIKLVYPLSWTICSVLLGFTVIVGLIKAEKKKAVQNL